MATPTPQGVKITLDKPRTILFNLEAYVAAEEITGRNYLKRATMVDLNYRDLRALLFASLRHEDAGLKISDVGRLVHPGNIAEVERALLEAWGLSMPESKEASEEDPLPETEGTEATATT